MRRATDTNADSNRAGIRSLDCGHDDGDDRALIVSRNAASPARDSETGAERAPSLGEQRQAV